MSPERIGINGQYIASRGMFVNDDLRRLSPIGATPWTLRPVNPMGVPNGHEPFVNSPGLNGSGLRNERIDGQQQ
jgi:hypothetical protein